MSASAATLSNISLNALETAMSMNEMQNSNYVLVVGLGATGLSVVRYLSLRANQLMVVDSRMHPPCLEQMKKEYPNVPIYLGAFDESLFTHAEQIVVSPGVALQEPALQSAIKQGIEIVGDIELFAQQITSPVIAVTGSNGKSTVVSLLGEMAKAAGINAVVGGNIGVPILDAMKDNCDLTILELSSFQLESVQSLKPVAAAALNVSPDHMDRYENYAEYINTKKHIYKASDVAIINRDDDKILAMQTNQNKVSGFTLQLPTNNDFGLRKVEDEIWLCQGTKPLIAASSLKITGTYNLANALAALALGNAANIPMKSMLAGLETFAGLPHRTQWVAEKNNITWINDSKGTNVGATLAAISGTQVKNKLVLIAGGMAKNANFMPLKSVICEKARAVVLIGKDASQIEQVLQQCVSVEYARDMQDAVNKAANIAQPGDTVLLSPACASFDMFENYEQRGVAFIKSIGKL